MNSEEALSHIPPDLQQASWLQQIVRLLQTQSRVIQEQTGQIQEQAEQICALKQTVQDLSEKYREESEKNLSAGLEEAPYIRHSSDPSRIGEVANKLPQ